MSMNYLISKITNFHQELKGGGSDWTIHSILQHQLVVSKVAPCEESFYFPLPKEQRNPMKRLINFQNKSSEFFRWCLVRYLDPVSKNPVKIRNIDRKLQNNLILKV